MIEKLKTLNFIIVIGIIACYFLGFFNPLIFGVYFILNGLFSLILFAVNKKPLWIGITSGFEYGMKKLLKSHYNRYLNLTSGIICLVFGFLMLRHYYG